MKAMKIALLGTAALAAASVGARADNLSDLKAQIETLNARVASLETAPSVPAGYSAVSFSKVGNEHVISIMPTADMPASTVITWSGWVRGAVVAVHDVTGSTYDGYNGSATYVGIYGTSHSAASYSYAYNETGLQTTLGTVSLVGGGTAQGVLGTVTTGTYNYSVGSAYTGKLSTDSIDVRATAEVVVTGKTDTAVGEVGVTVALEATGTTDAAYHLNSGQDTFYSDSFTGWWKVTPNFTFSATNATSLSQNDDTFDAQAYYMYAELDGGGIGVPPTGSHPAALRLAYADGPLSFAVALEDSNNVQNLPGYPVNGNSYSAIGVTGKASYSMDAFSLEATGGYWGNANAAAGVAGTQNAWSAAIGANVALGSAAKLYAAVGMGTGFLVGSDWTKASAFAKLGLGDTASAELGVTHTWNTSVGMGALDSTTFGGALYYLPVKQLRLGVEAGYTTGGVADGSYAAGLVSEFDF